MNHVLAEGSFCVADFCPGKKYSPRLKLASIGEMIRHLGPEDIVTAFSGAGLPPGRSHNNVREEGYRLLPLRIGRLILHKAEHYGLMDESDMSASGSDEEEAQSTNSSNGSDQLQGDLADADHANSTDDEDHTYEPPNENHEQLNEELNASLLDLDEEDACWTSVLWPLEALQRLQMACNQAQAHLEWDAKDGGNRPAWPFSMQLKENLQRLVRT